MKIKELMTKNVISVGSDEAVSKALSRMKSANVHQLIVTEGKALKGVIELKSIITKDIDPSGAKVSTFTKQVPSLSPEDDITIAIQMLLGSGLRALPVIEKGQTAGIISETDIMKAAPSILPNKDMRLKEIMTPCVYVGKDEKASKIKNLMFDANVSRIPILDGDEVIGVVGTLDLIKVMEAKASASQRDGKTQEKSVSERMKTSDITAESLMSKPVVFSSERKLVDSIQALQKNEEVVIKNGNIGIITPKDVLELLSSKKKKGVYVQITGMQDESSEFQTTMDSTVQDFVQKYSKMIDRIEYLAIHVERMQKQSPKQKCSVRVRMKAPFGFFVAHAWGWKPLDVVQEVFNKLEREITKKYEQVRAHGKSQKGESKRRF